jgi:hypothetical protein
MVEVGDWVDVEDRIVGRVSHRDPLTKAVFVEFPIESLEVTHPPNSVLKGMLPINASSNLGLLNKANKQNANALWVWPRLSPGQGVAALLQGEVVTLVPEDGVAVVKYEDPESLQVGHTFSHIVPVYNRNHNNTKRVHKKIGATVIPQAPQVRERPPLYVKPKAKVNLSRGIAAPKQGRPRSNANANLLVGLVNGSAAAIGGRRRKLTRKRRQTKRR